MLSELPFPTGISFLGRYGISTFSIFLLVGFLSATAILRRELGRRKLRPELTDNILLISVVSAIVGAKVFFIWEIWERIWINDIGFWDTFNRVFFSWNGMSHLSGGLGLWATLFSGGGLVFYGGVIVTFIALYVFLRMQKVNVWAYADSIAMVLALGYGFGRLGCFFSGDGCFGHGSSVNIPFITWVFGPEDGICPTDPSLKWKYPLICTYGIRVWNTPVMEAAVSFGFFALAMLRIRKINYRPGMMIALFFIVNGIARFLVEFIRVNDAFIPLLKPPSAIIDGKEVILSHFAQNHDLFVANQALQEKYFFEHWHWYGITQSQLIALILVGISIWWILQKKLYLRDHHK